MILRPILCIILSISVVDGACQSCVMDIMTVSGFSAPSKQLRLRRFDASPALKFLALLSAIHNNNRVVKSIPKNAANAADSKSGAVEEVMSESMIMAICFYKQWISPLIPPACRFLPTCSQCGVQA